MVGGSLVQTEVDVEVALDKQMKDDCITYIQLVRLDKNSLAKLIECVVKISRIQGLTRSRFQSELFNSFKPVSGCSYVDG